MGLKSWASYLQLLSIKFGLRGMHAGSHGKTEKFVIEN